MFPVKFSAKRVFADVHRNMPYRYQTVQGKIAESVMLYNMPQYRLMTTVKFILRIYHLY